MRKLDFKKRKSSGWLSHTSHWITELMGRIGLRSKLITIYAIAIFAPVATIGFLYIYKTQDIVAQQASEKLVSDLRQSAQDLNSMFMSVQSLCDMLSRDRTLLTSLNQQYDELINAYDTYQLIWKQSNNLKLTWPYVKNVTIYANNPDIITAPPYLVNMTDYMQDLSELSQIELGWANGYWSGMRSIYKSNEYWNPANVLYQSNNFRTFSYNRVMNTSLNNYVPQNILTVEIFESELTKRLNSLDALYEVVLVDSLGEELTSSAGVSYNESNLWKELIDTTEDGRIKPHEIIRTKKNIATYCYLENGWRLILCTSINAVMHPYHQIVASGMLFLLTSTIVSVALILFFSKVIAERTYRLEKKMGQFMDGSFTITDEIGGRDEIARMDEHFSSLAENLKSTVNERYVLELQRTQAKLELLQTQINPHFLYNALSTIGWLVEEKSPEVVRGAVESLAKFYQINLSKGKDLISLDSEMECLQVYLAIQKLRYSGRIKTYFQIDQALDKVQIPKLTLQALVENCIQHGMDNHKNAISILISSCEENDIALITVQDDGCGMTGEQLQALSDNKPVASKGNGVAIANINQRIKLHFGEEYGLTIASKENEGTHVEIRLPFYL